MERSGIRRMVSAAQGRAEDAAERGRAWADGRDGGSWSWVAISGWRCYRTVDGPLQSALLSLYVLVAIFPALLVMESYLDSHPAALAERLVRHYDLNASTAGLLLLLLLQFHERADVHPLVKAARGIGWVGVLVLFWVWAPSLLTHGLVPRRDLLPGAVLTAVGLVVVMVASGFVTEFWVNLYARDYGGFGVVLALYFWILFSSGVIVLAAAVSPSLVERRDLRRAG